MTSSLVLPSICGWDSPAVRRALSLALAAWLAFLVASMLHMHNAFWAAMPVWVISQPTRGVLLERSLFRVIGTVIGAAFGIALIHLLPISPFIQPPLLAIWIAAHAGLTHFHRGVHGYAALLSGITAVVVVVPSLLNPSESVLLALARVDCTLIGVVVGTLVMALLTPESPLADFYAQVRAVSADAVAYAAHVVRGGVDGDAEERRILDLISRLEATARMTAAGSLEGYRRQRHVDLLVVASLSAMAAARDARDGHSPVSADLPPHLERIAEHLRKDWQAPLPMNERVLEIGNDAALLGLDTAIGDILAADKALAQPGTAQSKTLHLPKLWLAPHRELGLAIRAGAVAGIMSLAAALLAFCSGNQALGLTAMGVCIFVQVLGSMPLPQMVAPKLIAGVLLGAVAAICYRIWIQPNITTSAALLLTLIPFVLLGGFARTHPKSGPLGIDSNMCFLMASQLGMPATHNLPLIFRETAALALGAGIVVAMFLLLPRSLRRQANDAAKIIRRDLQRILEQEDNADPFVWHARGSRQILRLSLHLGRLGEGHPGGLLATLNLGRAMIDLQRQGMPESAKTLMNSVLRHEVTPEHGAHALKLIAEEDPDDNRRPKVQRLSVAMEQASSLLTFGLAR